ncbi:helix-turn-helix domain-containing protein [Galbibacter sp. EGI 63066]|uniref:helix-turn-helix domain-containing protein n=1 Tax=Galbibacter sp. EGI 63066 TaxID=2993559 RepID=UPI0022497D7E|nr:helix-turn-helix domain-containing protein [Galbibacter sp. EGI 63066]MCX2682047.1 helix-turn-helix domain-containing protein [Galbibacter sp. EGI 63066]
MTFDNPVLFFFGALGVFNGLLISLYLLFFARQKRIQNFFFGLLVLMLSLRIGKSVYLLFTENRDSLYIQIGLSACFLIGVSLYFYLKSSVENIKTAPRAWKIHYGILLLIVLFVGIIKPRATNIELWNNYFTLFIYVVWGIYLLISGFVLNDIIQKFFNKKEKSTTQELWLVGVYIGNGLIFMAYVIGYFYLYLIGTLTFSLVFYALLFFLLSKGNRDSIFRDIPQKYASKKIEDVEAKALAKTLNEVMQKEKLYKNPNIKLNDVAEKVNISTHKLSQLLNDNIGKSFALFINEYRIDEAKRLIKESNQFTLEGIGFEAGFSSRSTFYNTFKKLVSQTPAEFKRQFS